MSAAVKSLVATGTKVWLDSVDPDLVAINVPRGVTGATSNPAIISQLIKTGRFQDQLQRLIQQGRDDEQIAWELTAQLVSEAQQVFLPIWQKTQGDDGYVSFELNPLLEDPQQNMPHAERVAEYVRLGKLWSAHQPNRMIKVPATPAGVDCLEPLVAAGVTINVTLIFTQRQWQAAADAIWRGAQQRPNLDDFKSVYSIFVSRIDVYTEKQHRQLSTETQGQVGIVNAQEIWQRNQEYWSQRPTRLRQEIIFASTGTKNPHDSPWKYVQALAGSDIQTCPPETIQAIADSSHKFTTQLRHPPAANVSAEIDAQIDFATMEAALMEEGIQKFADPQRQLLELIATKR